MDHLSISITCSTLRLNTQACFKKKFLPVSNFSSLQAVDFLVQATSASGVANAGTGPKTASNSTTTQPPDKSCTLQCQKIQPDVATPPDKVLKEDVVLDEDIEQV